MTKKVDNSGKKAKRNVYVCDQGHYGSTTCSLCRYDLRGKYPSKCPGCNADIIGEDIDYNRGGSDF